MEIIFSHMGTKELMLLFPFMMYANIVLGHYLAISLMTQAYFVVLTVFIFKQSAGKYAKDSILDGIRNIGRELRDSVKDAIAPKKFSCESIIYEFSKHRIGIGASVASLTQCDSFASISSEAVKIGSMLGLEDSIIDKFVGSVAGMVSNPAPIQPVPGITTPLNTLSNFTPLLQQHAEVESVIPVLATGLTLLGKEVTDVDFSKFINNQAKTMKSIEVVYEQIKTACYALGIFKPTEINTIVEITEELNSMRDEVSWLLTTLGYAANDLIKTEGFDRVTRLRNRARAIDARLKLILTPALKNHRLVTDVANIVAKVEDAYNQVLIIQAGYHIRPTPVGICIQGEKQIGKSTLVAQLIQKIKTELSKRPHFSNAVNWTQWSMNTRDEYDTGYQGQEITYSDDGFQAKDNLDHKFWITAISPEPMGTVQAHLSQKGMPFTSKLCVVTCNVLPQTSMTINCIEALQERFPCTILAKKVGNMPDKKSGSYDSSFSWLELQYGSMSQAIAGVTPLKNKHGRNTNVVLNSLPKTTIDDIVKDVVDRIVAENSMYEHKLSTIQALRQHADSDSEFESDCSMSESESDNEEIHVDMLDSLLSNLSDDQLHELSTFTNLMISPEVDDPILSRTRRRMGSIANSIRNHPVPQMVLDQARQVVVETVRTMNNIVVPFAQQLYLPSMNKLKLQNPDLSNQICSIAVAQSIMNEFSRKSIIEAKLASNGRYTEWTDLTGWTQFLTHRESGVEFNTYWPQQIDRSLANFISVIGTFKITQGQEHNFLYYWSRQRVIKVHHAPLDMDVLFGPTINNGRSLLPVGQINWSQFEDVNGSLNLHDTTYRRWEVLISSGCLFAARVGLSTSPVMASFLAVYASLAPVRYMATMTPYLGFYQSMSARALTGISLMTFNPTLLTMSAIKESYDYITEIANKFALHMTGKLICLLESFGIPVSDLFIDLISISSKVVVQTAAFALFCLLLFVIYKFVIFIITPKKDNPQKLELHNSNKERRMSRRKIVKNSRVRKLAQHCDREWCDLNDCDDDVELDPSQFPEFLGRHDFEPETCYVLANCSRKFTAQDLKDIISEAISSTELDCSTELSIFRTKKTKHIGVVGSKCDEFNLPMEDGRYKNRCTKLCKSFYYDKSGKKINTILSSLEIAFNYSDWVNDKVVDFDKFLEPVFRESVLDFNITVKLHSKPVDPDNVRGEWIILCMLEVECLSPIIQGTRSQYTKNSLKSLNDDFNDITGKKAKSDVKADSVVLPVTVEPHCTSSSMAVVEAIRKNHMVLISSIDYKLIDSTNPGLKLFGIGSGNFIYFNAHAVLNNDYIRWWRPENFKDTYRHYNLAHVIFRDTVRDVAIARIIPIDMARQLQIGQLRYMATQQDSFSDMSKYLLDAETWKAATVNGHILIYLPKHRITTSGTVCHNGTRYYSVNSVVRPHDYYEISEIHGAVHLSTNGDCGGPVVISSGKYSGKLIGFYSGTMANKWVGSILTYEDLAIKNFVDYHSDSNEVIDSWSELIVSGDPIDLPKGEACSYVGRLINKTLPAANMSLDHWHLGPFSSEFDIQLFPGPLDPDDERIEIEVPRNMDGRKSLLLIPNSVMCQTIPRMCQKTLDICKTALIKEHALFLRKYLCPIPSDIDEMLHLAMNGRPEWEYCTGMEVNKAAGLPWSVVGKSMKKDLIDLDPLTGLRTFNNGDGQHLKSRLVLKLSQAKEGNRLLSFGNSKLKDTVIPLNKVKKGATRAFTCMSVDSVLFDASLYGAFKEAYTKCGLELHHAIGVDPHSLGWKAIYDHMNVYEKCFDLDFKNYDKILHREIMITVFEIMREVIQILQPDEWDKAREVAMWENIETYIVDYDTIYKTERGNKSGCYLTTVLNCIANDIYSFYAWIKLTGNTSLVDFRHHVHEVSFGDDKISSVSDEYCEQYNYLTVKSIMENIGHTITPGNKDGVECKYDSIYKLQFLKRSFSLLQNYVVAPLMIRSLESPYTYTDLSNFDLEIWRNIVCESLFEACLHGKQYYDDFCQKLGKCEDPAILEYVGLLLTESYENMVQKYINRYYAK